MDIEGERKSHRGEEKERQRQDRDIRRNEGKWGGRLSPYRWGEKKKKEWEREREAEKGG